MRTVSKVGACGCGWIGEEIQLLWWPAMLMIARVRVEGVVWCVVCGCCFLSGEERRVEDVEYGVAQVLALERWSGV